MAGVAGRYALALYELAHDQGQVDDVAKNLDAFDALYRESDDLRRLVRSPAYSAAEQTAAVGALLDRAGISGLAANFIKLTAAVCSSAEKAGLFTRRRRSALSR